MRGALTTRSLAASVHIGLMPSSLTLLGRYELVRNDKIEFQADVPAEADRGSVKVVMERSEIGANDRIWPHVEVVEWERITSRIW